MRQIKLNGLRALMAILALYITPFASSLETHPLDDLKPGQWYEVPNSKMEAVYPSPLPGGGHPENVMESWGGGAYDTRRDRLIVWGGGHNDYSGNELYVFDVDTLKWIRLTEPSDPAPREVLRYPDGRPSSRHTYNYTQYAPNVDKYFSLGVGAAWGGSAPSGVQVDAFNFDSREWEIKAAKPDNGKPVGSISAYDPATGKLWHHGIGDAKSGLLSYDPTRDAWSGSYGNYRLKMYATAAIDPVRGIMVATGGDSNDATFLWNLDSPGGPTVVNTAGDRSLESAQGPGFVYDPVSDKFVGWDGGAYVYTLDPDTWVWTKVSAAASNAITPTVPALRGTYGRFQYIPSKNAFILVNNTDGNVYFYRLTSAKAAPVAIARELKAASERRGGAVDAWMLLALALAFGWKFVRLRG